MVWLHWIMLFLSLLERRDRLSQVNFEGIEEDMDWLIYIILNQQTGFG